MGSRTYTTAMDAQGRVSQTWDTQAGNRALSYDGRGNVTALGSLTFSYDHSDQPVATGGSAVGSYVYDGHLRRVRATSGGVTRYNVFDLSGRLVFVDTPSSGTSVAYVPGPEGTLARVDQAGVVSFQHADHLGSGASATNAAGAVLWRERYTPFGEKLLAPAANDNQASFTGHIDDAATGLTYMQARYYDPALGRFLSIDPVEFSAARPDMFNRYAYAANDPVNMIDPDGRAPDFGTPPQPVDPPLINETIHVWRRAPKGAGAPSLAGRMIVSGLFATQYDSPVPGPADIIGAIMMATGTGIGIYDLISESRKPPRDAADPHGAKAPGKPGEPEGFVEPPGGATWGQAPNGEWGWVDDNGNVWVPTGQGGRAHGGPHWDVQDANGNGHTNVYPGGHVR